LTPLIVKDLELGFSANGALTHQRSGGLVDRYECKRNRRRRDHRRRGNGDRPKFVASTTLTDPLEWKATLLKGDVVEAVAKL
jgi:hypothetical protein